MPQIEVEVPEHIEEQIDMLVDQDEFLNRENAIEELLSRGVSIYETTTEGSTVEDPEMYSQTVTDQQDPAMQDEHSDEEYTF